LELIKIHITDQQFSEERKKLEKVLKKE
jgi:hypothetical protein